MTLDKTGRIVEGGIVNVSTDPGSESVDFRSDIEQKIRQTRSSYDTTVEEYFQNTKDLQQVNAARQFFAKLPGGPSILDHGCGPGRDAKMFTEVYKCAVTGIDLSQGMIDFAKKYAPKADFIVADMRRLPFRDLAFDGVWSIASLLNLPKSEVSDAVQEVRRVLKPKGIFNLRLKQGVGERFELDMRYNPPVPKVVSLYTPAEISWFLEKSGFLIESLDCKTPVGNYQKSTELNIFSRKL